MSLVPLLPYKHVMGWWKWCACAVVVLIATPHLNAQDSAEQDYPTQFLEKLREQGWHDIALDYLERIEDDPLVTREFLDSVGYQLAATRAALAREAIGERQRQLLLEQARSGFQEFAKAHPESPYRTAALSQIGNMLAEQALGLLNKADRLPAEVATEQENLRTEARGILDQAVAAVDELLLDIEKQLAKLPRGAALQAKNGASQLKQDLLTKQAEGRFLAANLGFERARTYQSSSNEYEQALDTAAKGFRQLRKDYENKLVGFYAVLYEGRCYQSAGNFKRALDTYEELVRQPVGQADFRKLMARATRYRIECHLASDDVDEAIEEGSDWLDQSYKEELTQPEWLAVAYRLADAYSDKARSDDGEGNVSRLRTEARKLYREVAQHQGEFQDDARAALALSGSDETKIVEVRGFKEAFSEGKSALERMSTSQLAVRLAANNNPEAVEDLEAQVAANRDAALKYFQRAVELSDDKTDAEDAVAARYYLCWLYWEDGRTEEAAELGQQIADKFPDSAYAPTAAKVTLAAYERLYLNARQSASPNDVASASEKLRSIAELIVERWNDSEAATTAANLLISLALRENDFDEADRLLEKLPKNSRGAAGLNLGGSLWSEYLSLTAGSKGPPSQEAQALRSRAAELLAEGYEAIADQSDITPPQAAGVLYYVQVLLADGNSDKAIEVLENERVGPLSIAAQGRVSESERTFAIEAYKAALRAYVSADPPRTDDAIAMMEKLEATTSGSEKARDQLTGIYVSLSLQLQEQVQQLTSAGNTAKAREVSKAFSSLLERVAERSDSQSWSVKNWLAQTSLQLGSGLSGPEADRYLKQAEDVYRDILATVEKDPSFAPNELAVLAVRKKLGETLQARGFFAGAMEQFTAILAEKPNMLELQQAAATALQDWGIEKKDPNILNQAIRGTNPGADGKNRVWGWLQLATVADIQRRRAEKSGSNAEAAEKYKDAFFDARLQAARARLAAAKISSGESQAKQLATVRQSVAALKQLYPDLGGAQWQARFDRLLEEATP